MRALEILHARLEARLGFVHASRWGSLWRVVIALIVGKKLWLTALGRALPSDALRKHAIKAVDRLLGNRLLYRERFAITAAVASLVVRDRSRPIVLVDTVEIQRRVIAVTAALAHAGRSFPIWSTKVRHYRLTPSESRRFLRELSQVLPASSRPILVTDAGFETPWIREVEARGWDYVARVRGMVQVRHRATWTELSKIRALATRRAKNIGPVQLCKRSPVPRRMVLSKLPTPQHRQVITRTGPARGTNYRVYRANAYEPIVAVTSLSCCARAVIEIYALRMQIEESFRDLKNHRWGWSLRHCGSRSRQRIEVLLLVASIAALVQQLVGMAAEALGLHRSHQANTVRRRVLSVFVLGGIILNDSRLRPPAPTSIARAIGTLRREIVAFGGAAP